MRETGFDQELAKAATSVLARNGRPDLAVTTRQVRSWRQLNLLPVVGDRRGGRARASTYADGAARTAAELAIALADDRNIARATLTAFARGATLPEDAVRRAYHEVIDGLVFAARRARSPQSRADRPPVGGLARRDKDLVFEVFGAIVAGDRPSADETQAAITALAPDIATAGEATDGWPETVSMLADLFSLNGFAQTIEQIDLDAAQHLCQGLRVVRDYSAAIAAFAAELGTGEITIPSLSPHDLGIARLIAKLSSPFPGATMTDCLIAVIAPIIAQLFGDRRSEVRRNFDNSVEAMRADTARACASRAFVVAMGDRWKPYLGFDSALQLATLPAPDLDELRAAARAWAEAHPSLATALGAGPTE